MNIPEYTWIYMNHVNIPDMRADTLGWLRTQMLSIKSWNTDIADLWVPMAWYPNLFSNNSAKKSSTSFIFDLVGNISRSEHEPQHFLEADSLCLIEDVLLLFVMRLEALSDFPSAN